MVKALTEFQFFLFYICFQKTKLSRYYNHSVVTSSYLVTCKHVFLNRLKIGFILLLIYPLLISGLSSMKRLRNNYFLELYFYHMKTTLLHLQNENTTNKKIYEKTPPYTSQSSLENHNRNDNNHKRRCNLQQSHTMFTKQRQKPD